MKNFSHKNLQSFKLRECGLSFEPLEQLLSNPNFASLRELDVSQNYDVNKFIDALAKSQTLNK